MALLIYKQWHRNSNERGTPASNAKHIKYIGERIHVLKKGGAKNGLFGQFGGKPFTDDIATKEAQNYVKKISDEGKTVFRSCISFTPERAEMLGLGNDLNRWEKFVRYNVYTIAKNNGIGMRDMEYLAAVHVKKGQPHIHITFWNKNQQVGINYIDPERCNEVREKLETKVYGELAEDIGEEDALEILSNNSDFTVDNSDKARKELITRVFSNERTALFDIQNKLRERLFEKDTGAVNAAEKARQFWNYPKLWGMLRDITKEVPSTGRLSYGYMPDHVKNMIDDMSDELMDEFPKLRQIFDGILDVKRSMGDMYNSTDTNYGRWQTETAVGKERDKLYTKMGNKILKVVKAQRIEEYMKHKAQSQARTQEKQNARQKEQTAELILSIGRLLEQEKPQTEASALQTAKYAFGKGDLSRAERLELAYENKDKGKRER